MKKSFPSMAALLTVALVAGCGPKKPPDGPHPQMPHAGVRAAGQVREAGIVAARDTADGQMLGKRCSTGSTATAGAPKTLGTDPC